MQVTDDIEPQIDEANAIAKALGKDIHIDF